jgi:excinuclease ABC subunit C
VAEAFGLDAAARADRGLRQQPHPGDQRRRRHGRGRARRLQKNQYRKFNIKGTELAPGDDYGMMREVLTPPLFPRW